MNILDENLEMQHEEKLAICAIYGDSILQHDQHNSTNMQSVYILTVNVDQDHDMNASAIQYTIRSPRKMVLRLFFPSTYPSHDMPVFEMTSVYCDNTKIDSDMVDTIQRDLRGLFQPGQVVLLDWIQWLENYIRCHVEESTTGVTVGPAVAVSRNHHHHHHSDRTTSLDNNKDDDRGMISPPVSAAGGDKKVVPTIYSSESLVDRKSIFVAHVAPVKSAGQVKQVVSTLLENKKIARATHNIMAYRINLAGDTILQDNDDDGETAAGGRLMHLLQILDVKNVVVVVSRWFGGVLLGPDRFKDIKQLSASSS